MGEEEGDLKENFEGSPEGHPEGSPEETPSQIGYCKDHGEVPIKDGKFCPTCHKLVRKTPPYDRKGEGGEEESILETVESLLKAEKIEKDVKDEVMEWLECADIPSWSDAPPQFFQWLQSSVVGQLKNLGVSDKKLLKVGSKLSNIIDRRMMEKDKVRRFIEMPLYRGGWQGGNSYLQATPLWGGAGSGTGAQPPNPSQPFNYSPTGSSGIPVQNPPQAPSAGVDSAGAPARDWRGASQDQRTTSHRSRPKVYKVVVEGQTLETEDPQEFIALKRYEEERKEREEEKQRRQEEHDMRMKQLEEEIKATTEKKKSHEKDEEEDTVSIPIDDNFSIDVPRRDAFLWYIMKSQQGSSKGEEEKVPITIEGQEMMVPPTTAALINMRKAEKDEKVRELENKARAQEAKIESYEQALKKALSESGGHRRAGMTAMDLANAKLLGGNDIKEILKEGAKNIPAMTGREAGKEVEYTPEMNPEERAEKAKEVMSSLNKSSEAIDRENKFIGAVKKSVANTVK